MWLDGACCYCLYQGLSPLDTPPPPPPPCVHHEGCERLKHFFFCMLFHPLKILNFVWSQNWSFPLLFFFSSLLLSTARLSLIRMMDGAELWLQPSPAASWELRDTEWEVEGTVLGRESGSSEGGGGSCLAVPCAVHMVILPNEIIPYRVCLSLVFRLVAIDEVKAARRISLITSTSPPDSEPECGDL